ncbi:zinc-ribbon domain-containing protein [Wenzhouxiangella sediminis]|uniref:Zinc ribbon domain-containing protein n=1 Tax=Wenzhouxiangella sediminis TaxID=1792836 RepID=A0A3E1K997_9GAMM|nr:zinc ribbon domain-containing protein [Wenzhouxiangella sediminis]RFF30584.1 zinc ribbon domain-containing protein [Wenzhouxiangella sediminis]
MALIDCPECGHQVSDKASTCPSCGVGISEAKEAQSAGEPITTVQQTSKKFKQQALLAAVVIAAGIMIVFSNGGSTSDAIGWTITLIGFGWLIVARINVWWHHD